MTTQDDHLWESVLHCKGIEWKIGRFNDLTFFCHRSITVGPAPKENVHQVKNHLNQVVFSHPEVAECLQNATQRILDVYAMNFVPLWEQNHEEIPVYWDVERSSASYGQSAA
jgi:hypothetical protein